MSHQCDEPDCYAGAPVYYQCSDKQCKHQLGFCKTHGGLERSERAMKIHLDVTHRLIVGLLSQT